MPFAQLVIGPPGSGKSTYCDGMQQFLGTIGRKCSVVNLDPANDTTSYHSAIDVRDLASVENIQNEQELGPNAAVLYALEEVEENFEWLEEALKKLGEDYVLFDCPGQVELFTHHASLRNIFFKIQKLGYRLVAVHLTDSYTLTLPSLYVSALLQALRAMLQMELPHVNVLSKVDKLASYPKLPFELAFYTEVQDLSYLLPHLAAEGAGGQPDKFASLNEAVLNLVEEFGLVAFEPLVVEDKRSMMSLLAAIDRAGGYAFGSAEGANDSVWQVAMRDGFRGIDVRDVQERWIDRRDELDEKERHEAERANATTPGQIPDDQIDTGVSPLDNGIKTVRKK